MENNKMDVSILDYRSGTNYIFRNIPKDTVKDDEVLEFINHNFGYNFTDSNTIIMVVSEIEVHDIDVNRQQQYQEDLQKIGFNIVVCCRCGNTLIHKESDTRIQCNGCWNIVNTQDCSDLNY